MMSVIGTSSGPGRAAGDDSDATYKGVMIASVIFLLVSTILVCVRLYSWYGIVVTKFGGS
jgi:hypothetical protein